jgi:hypothetical protein
METIMVKVVVLGAFLLLSACSDEGEPTLSPGPASSSGKTGDHVWKTQTDMMDKAGDVENILMDAHELQQQRIDEQAR